MLAVNINFLWAAIALSCIALAFIIVGGVEDIDWSKYISLIFGLVAIVFWIIVLLIQFGNSNRTKYQTLLNRQTQAERNVEKYLIDHPEFRVLEIDENGQIVKVDK